jgi:hypothetical protein
MKIRYQEDEAKRLGYRTTRLMRKSMATRKRYKYDDKARGKPQPARLNHARWLVDCPFCLGAEIVSHIDPVFFCQSCGMADNDGHTAPVKFPPFREEVDALMRQRPERNCNWEHGETVEYLRRDNDDHGIED